MLEITPKIIDAVALAIMGWLAGWKTPDDFADYVEDDSACVAIEFLADSHHGIHIPQVVADYFGVVITPEDEEYDMGWELIEETGAKLAEQIQAGLDAQGIPGSVFFGSMEHSGDYALQWCVSVDDLPYPPK